MTWPTQQGVYDAGDLTLQSGARIPSARLSWKAHGTVSSARDNVIVYPTSYGAQHPDLEWLIGPDKILDPTRWFIIIPDMFGNGLSSSPSDTQDYPTLVTIHDNVRLQRRALPTCLASNTSPASMVGRWARCRPIIGPRCSRTQWSESS
jgi:homoserine O-acetyltransferase/O-succinyltransferase